MGKHVVKVNGVWLDEEAAAERGQMAGSAYRGAIALFLYLENKPMVVRIVLHCQAFFN